MIIPPIKLFFPPEDIEQIKSDVEKILFSGMLTLGTYTKNFEDEFTALCEVQHAIAVNSGTAALEIAMRSLGLKEGDEVLVPTNTFSATAASVYHSGGKPVLTDIDPEYLSIDVENLQRHLTSKTKGVIIVHIGGLICPDIKAIKEICEDQHLFLIEDAAHAHGSTMNGQWAGSFGDAGCFSFYPTKVITTGEGGMITTNSMELVEKARILRDQGKEGFYNSNVIELGNNWRMDEVSAAIGLTQLKRLAEIVEKRNEIAKYYDRQLKGLSEIRPQRKPPGSLKNYYKYIVFLDRDIETDSFKQKLRERGVTCSGEVYWPPLHLQPVYKKLLNTRQGDFPEAEDACSRMICLPMYTQMSMDEAEYVVEKITEVLKEL